MGRQRNMAQMKEQIKTPEELNKMEISNLSNTELKTLVIRMFKELSEDLSSIKKIQSGMKDTLIEIKTIYRETKVEWMKPRIKSMIGNKEAKKKKKEKEIKKERKNKTYQKNKRKELFFYCFHFAGDQCYTAVYLGGEKDGSKVGGS